MEPLKYSELSVDNIQLVPHTLEKLVYSLRKGLVNNYAEVNVDIVECPNLTKEPFNLAGEGLGGDSYIVQVGDPGYVIPNALYEKVYSFRDVAKATGLSKAFIIGCGGGPLFDKNRFYEMVANAITDEGGMKCFTKNVYTVDKENKIVRTVLTPPDEHRFSCLGSLFCCKGTREKVIKVSCKKRIGSDNLPRAICNSLNTEFEEPIGLGVIFKTAKGAIQHYVASAYPKDVTDLQAWVNKPLIQAPLVSVGIIVTKSPDGFSMPKEHFHSYTIDNTTGGHYQYDITPEIIEHEAYIAPAKGLCVIDKAKNPLILFK